MSTLYIMICKLCLNALYIYIYVRIISIFLLSCESKDLWFMLFHELSYTEPYSSLKIHKIIIPQQCLCGIVKWNARYHDFKTSGYVNMLCVMLWIWRGHIYVVELSVYFMSDSWRLFPGGHCEVCGLRPQLTELCLYYIECLIDIWGGPFDNWWPG